MRSGWKLLTVYLLILSSFLFAFYLWTDAWLRTYSVELIEAQLKAQLLALGMWVDVDDPEIDAEIDQAGAGATTRITLMDRTGKVVADSALSGAALASLDNHLNRPEVQEALRTSLGTSLRYSTSVDRELLYVAMKLPGERGFVRVAVGMDEVMGHARGLGLRMMGLALVLGLLGAGMVFWLSARSARSSAALEAAIGDLARGELDTPVAGLSAHGTPGSVRGLTGIAGRLRQMDSALGEERRYLDAVLSSLTEGILVCGDDGRICYVNPALIQMVGLAENPIGRLPLEMVRQPQVHEAVQRVLKEGQPASQELALDGKTLEVRVSAIRPQSRKGAVVAIFHDISELRRLERVRQDFVANVSHELRTPLTSIQGYCETLEEQSEGLSDQQKVFLGKIASNSAQLAEIVQALLDLSRIEGGRLRPERERISVKDLREELEKTFSERARQKALQWTLDFDGVTTFSASRSLLLRALHNLVDNAFQHTERGKVEVLLGREEGAIRFEVADTGVGIPESEQARVFERFYRASDRRASGKGSGVGLSIVKHVVALHGGKIWLESQWGKGTRVIFTLPQTDAESSEDANLP